MYLYIDKLTQENDLVGLRNEESRLEEILQNYRLQLHDILHDHADSLMHTRQEVEQAIKDTLETLDYVKACRRKVTEIVSKKSCD